MVSVAKKPGKMRFPGFWQKIRAKNWQISRHVDHPRDKDRTEPFACLVLITVLKRVAWAKYKRPATGKSRGGSVGLTGWVPCEHGTRQEI